MKKSITSLAVLWAVSIVADYLGYYNGYHRAQSQLSKLKYDKKHGCTSNKASQECADVTREVELAKETLKSEIEARQPLDTGLIIMTCIVFVCAIAEAKEMAETREKARQALRQEREEAAQQAARQVRQQVGGFQGLVARQLARGADQLQAF